MKWARFLILLAVTVVLQRGVTPAIEVGGVRPDLVVLLVLHLSLIGPPGSVFVAQWVAGLVRDIFSGGLFGLSALCFPVVGWLMGRLGSDLYARHPLTQLGLTFLGGLQIELIFAFVLFLKASHLDPFALFVHGLGTAFYTGIAALLFFRLLDGWPVTTRDGA